MRTLLELKHTKKLPGAGRVERNVRLWICKPKPKHQETTKSIESDPIDYNWDVSISAMVISFGRSGAAQPLTNNSSASANRRIKEACRWTMSLGVLNKVGPLEFNEAHQLVIF
jgi:hypothetical protein